MPRDGRPFRCFKKTCCAAVPVPFLPIPHAGLFPCDCGHANKYCGVCDAFFERVVDCADPGRSSRMGYHYAGHVPRQNFADRVLWGSAGSRPSPACTCSVPADAPPLFSSATLTVAMGPHAVSQPLPLSGYLDVWAGQPAVASLPLAVAYLCPHHAQFYIAVGPWGGALKHTCTHVDYPTYWRQEGETEWRRLLLGLEERFTAPVELHVGDAASPLLFKVTLQAHDASVAEAAPFPVPVDSLDPLLAPLADVGGMGSCEHFSSEIASLLPAGEGIPDALFAADVDM